MSPFLRKATRPYAYGHPHNNPWAWYVILNATSAGSQSLQKVVDRLDIYRGHLDAVSNNMENERTLMSSLTHWGRVMHICIGNITIIGSDNGLSPSRRQAIICTNAGILLIGPLGTNFSEILIEIHTFSFKKMHLKTSSGKKAAILSRPQCNVLMAFLSSQPWCGSSSCDIMGAGWLAICQACNNICGPFY